MRTLLMGTPSYAIPVLEALLSLSYKVVAVVTQPDRSRGRGRISEPPPVGAFALGRGIDVNQPPSLRRVEVQQQLASLDVDLIVVAAYGKIIPPEVLAIPTHGCVNVHPSLLPRHRGPSPVATAILEGDEYTGTSIMLLDEGMDTGPILASRSASINGSATTGDLTEHLFQLGAELLSEVLPRWTGGEITAQPQDHSKTTVTRKLEKTDGEANWELSAVELERRVRAFTPWPGLYTRWKGSMLKILSAVPLGSTRLTETGGEVELPRFAQGLDAENKEPGLAVRLGESELAAGVITGRGILGLKVLQMEGRRPITSKEFLRGYRDFPGSKLPS